MRARVLGIAKASLLHNGIEVVKRGQTYECVTDEDLAPPGLRYSPRRTGQAWLVTGEGPWWSNNFDWRERNEHGRVSGSVSWSSDRLRVGDELRRLFGLAAAEMSADTKDSPLWLSVLIVVSVLAIFLFGCQS